MIKNLVEDYKLDPVATIKKFKSFKKTATLYDIEQLNNLLSQAIYVLRGQSTRKGQYSAISTYFIYIVAKTVGYTEKELLSRCRKGDIPLGKQLLTWFLIERKISAAEIMKICNYRNPSSITFNCETIETLIRLKNKKVIAYVETIKKEAFLNTYLNQD